MWLDVLQYLIQARWHTEEMKKHFKRSLHLWCKLLQRAAGVRRLPHVSTTISTTAIFQNTEIRPFMYLVVRYQVASGNLSSAPISANTVEMTVLVRPGIFREPRHVRQGWSGVMYYWDEGMKIVFGKSLKPVMGWEWNLKELPQIHQPVFGC